MKGEVLKILEKRYGDDICYDTYAEEVAEEICQLFESEKSTVKLPQVVGKCGEANDEPKPHKHIFSFQTGLCECGESLRESLIEPKPDEGRLLSKEKPWNKENWQEAKGISFKKGETNSAFAERDYSIKCEADHLIATVKGYWIWWCSSHHQPLAWCEGGKAKAQRDLTASIKDAEHAMSYKEWEEATMKAEQVIIKGKDAECQERVKGILGFIEQYKEPHEHMGVIDFVGVPLDEWHALKGGVK